MEKPNRNYIEELSGGDKDFEDKLFKILQTEFPEEQKAYFTHLESVNFKELYLSVHKIKHKISILGLEKSYEVANVYEKNLRNNSLEGKNEFKKILENITNYLAKL